MFLKQVSTNFWPVFSILVIECKVNNLIYKQSVLRLPEMLNEIKSIKRDREKTDI